MIVVPDTEWDEFVRHMTVATAPTPALLDGKKLLDSIEQCKRAATTPAVQAKGAVDD